MKRKLPVVAMAVGALVCGAWRGFTSESGIRCPGNAVVDMYTAASNDVTQFENDRYSTRTGTPGNGVAYCTSSGASTAHEYIQLIAFGAIDYVSGNNNGYGDFTSVSADVTAGETYTIQGKAGYTGAVRKEVWTLYIDYNADGDFADADEKVGSTVTNTAFLITKTFKIPRTAKNGPTRMRIQMHYNTLINNPCAKFDNGEVEDYTINISGGSAIAQAAVPGEIN